MKFVHQFLQIISVNHHQGNKVKLTIYISTTHSSIFLQYVWTHQPPDVNRRSFAANYTNFRSDPIRISLRGFNLPRRRLRSIPLMTDRLTGWLISQPAAVNAMEEDYWCKSHLVDTGKPQNHHLPHGRSVSQFSVVIRGK